MNETMKQADELYARITRKLISENMQISTMESCTSGLIASLLTDTEGSSAVYKGGFVTYSNQAKIMQGVPADVIRTYGVYSKETAEQMAEACRRTYGADIGVGVTGSFGNVDPANADSVIGEVYFAVSSDQGTESYAIVLPEHENRLAYKLSTAAAVAEKLLDLLHA